MPLGFIEAKLWSFQIVQKSPQYSETNGTPDKQHLGFNSVSKALSVARVNVLEKKKKKARKRMNTFEFLLSARYCDLDKETERGII